jgi:hypothetical protein
MTIGGQKYSLLGEREQLRKLKTNGPRPLLIPRVLKKGRGRTDLAGPERFAEGEAGWGVAHRRRSAVSVHGRGDVRHQGGGWNA